MDYIIEEEETDFIKIIKNMGKYKCCLFEEHGCCEGKYICGSRCETWPLLIKPNQPLFNIEHITKDTIYSDKKWACEECLECDDECDGSIGMAYFLIKNLQTYKKSLI